MSQVLRRFLKFDYKRTIEDGSSKCGYHCETFGLSEPSSQDQEYSVKAPSDQPRKKKMETKYETFMICEIKISIYLFT